MAGLLLVTLALPRLGLAFSMLGLERNSGTENLDFLWPANAPALAKISELQTRQAIKEGARKNPALLDPAHQSVTASLSRGPANPESWARLAQINLLRNAPAEKIEMPLRLSFMTGPWQPYLLTPRLTLALKVWPMLGSATQEITKEQIRQMADHHWIDQLATAAKAAYSSDVIRKELSVTPEQETNFLKKLAKTETEK